MTDDDERRKVQLGEGPGSKGEDPTVIPLMDLTPAHVLRDPEVMQRMLGTAEMIVGLVTDTLGMAAQRNLSLGEINTAMDRIAVCAQVRLVLSMLHATHRHINVEIPRLVDEELRRQTQEPHTDA